MKKYLFCLAMIVGAAASADELADANKALDTKAYPQAMQLLSKLAAAGNAEAQMHLGEMYWYGMGVAVDMPKADELFKKSAAAGYKPAQDAATWTSQRQAHLSDIDYWMNKYDGAELRSGKFSCPVPMIPNVSRKNDEIKEVSAAVQTWYACYDGAVDNINASLPPGKRIPVAIATLMTDVEFDQAKLRLDGIYAKTSAALAAEASQFLAKREAWVTATEAYATENNKNVAILTAQQKAEYEDYKRQIETYRVVARDPAPSTQVKK